jgi:hypothetical protein
VTIGDMTAARVPGAPFTLVYLVANTIMNVTSQEDQLAVFANAAAHLAPGGCFAVQLWPSELDLMGRISGFRLGYRWAGWDRAPFTSESASQVAVFERLA